MLGDLQARMAPAAVEHMLTVAWAHVLDTYDAQAGDSADRRVVVLARDGLGRGRWQFQSGHSLNDPTFAQTHAAPGPMRQTPEHPQGDPPTHRYPADESFDNSSAYLAAHSATSAGVHDGQTIPADAGTLAVDSESAGTVLENPDPTAPPLGLCIAGRVTWVSVSPIVLGRGEEADIQLPNTPTISRRHASLIRNDGRWWVSSTGRNGLQLNGRPVVGQAALSHKDTLHFGMKASSPQAEVRLHP
jgi:hypothetical protein